MCSLSGEFFGFDSDRSYVLCFCIPAAGSWPIPADRKALFNPVMAFMGNKGEETAEEMSEKDESSHQESETEKSLGEPESLDHKPVVEGNKTLETDDKVHMEAEETTGQEENKVIKEEDGEHTESADGTIAQNLDHGKEENHLLGLPVELPESPVEKFESSDSVDHPKEKEVADEETSGSRVSMQLMPSNLEDNVVESVTSESGESHGISDRPENSQVETKEESKEEERVQAEESVMRISSVQPEASGDSEKRDDTNTSVLHSVASEETNNNDQSYNEHLSSATSLSEVVTEVFSPENETTAKENEKDHITPDIETDMKEHHLSSERTMSDSGSLLELERVKREMKMMEAALQGAARQAQVFHLMLVIRNNKSICNAYSFSFKWPDFLA